MLVGTWNMLADRYYVNKKYKSPCLKWSDRCSTQCTLLLESRCDVICLQEVELQTFATDFQSVLGAYDYVVQTNTRKRTSPIGNVVLWDRRVLQQIPNTQPQENSSCIFVALTEVSKLTVTTTTTISQQVYLFGSVHLRAGLRSNADTRVCQLKSTYKMLSKLKAVVSRLSYNRSYSPSHQHVCIMGDFNDTLVPGGAVSRLVHTERKAHDLQLRRCPYLTFNGRRPTVPTSCFSFDHLLVDARTHVTFLISSSFVDVHSIPNRDIPSDHLFVRAAVHFNPPKTTKTIKVAKVDKTLQPPSVSCKCLICQELETVFQKSRRSPYSQSSQNQTKDADPVSIVHSYLYVDLDV